MLGRLDNEDYSQAKVASSVGVFKEFLLNKCSQEQFESVVDLIRKSPRTTEIDNVLKVFESFLHEED